MEDRVIDPEQLIERLRAGDLAAPRIFLEEYGPYLHAVLRRRFSVSKEVHEDLMQSVLLHLMDNNWRVLSRWNGVCRFETYLATVANNKGIDHLRAEQRHVLGGDIDSDELLGGADSTDYAWERQIKTLVEGMLDTLGLENTHCRKLLLLKYMHFFSYSEIAELMELSVNQVGVYLKRCLNHARTLLGIENPFDDTSQRRE